MRKSKINPKHFKRIASKRMKGKKLIPAEDFYLWYWMRKFGGEL